MHVRTTSTSLPVWRSGRAIGSGALGPRGLGVRADVDAPAGELGRQAGILALLADRQGELEVGYDDAGRPGGLVDQRHALDLRRRQRVGDELRRVVAVVDDVDLLAVQLVHDVA